VPRRIVWASPATPAFANLDVGAAGGEIASRVRPKAILEPPVGVTEQRVQPFGHIGVASCVVEERIRRRWPC